MNDMMSTGAGVAALITHRQAALGLTDAEVATALGYENERVTALLKSGSMKIPVNKVAALAKTLQLDGFELLRAALTESAPELWQAIQELTAPLGSLHPTEVNLLRHLRQLCGDQELKPIVFDGKGVVVLVSVGGA
jgi:hypothetical protein